MFGRKNDRQVDQCIYVIYDSKVGSYGDINYAVNDADLCRQFVRMFRDPKQSQNKYLLDADDYSLFCIGDYEYATGTIVPCSARKVVGLHELRFAAQKLMQEDAVRLQVQEMRKAVQDKAESDAKVQGH